MNKYVKESFSTIQDSVCELLTKTSQEQKQFLKQQME